MADPKAAAASSSSCSREQCAPLERAGLASNLLHPEDDAYRARTESYWSVSAQLRPCCIVQPTSTEEVARAVRALVQDTNLQFAVRSGGHMVWPGSNNVDGGVTIDLGLMNKTTYDAETKIASIQAGSRWQNVYEALTPLGVTVPGGRAAGVGVAGFLIGGGNSFYSARYGFACDNVVNFEVVLATGEVINANADEHPDLWQALKGGSANFGIVTRFDMRAIEAADLWGGVIIYPYSTSDQHVRAYVNWCDAVESYPFGSAIGIWTYMQAMKEIVILAAYEDTSGAVAASPAFDEFMAIPDALSSSMRVDSHLNITVELQQATGYSDIWFELTFANDAAVFARLVKLHEDFVAAWKAQSPDGDFITQALFQPIPALFARHSVARGGNVLGLDRESRNAMMFQSTLAVKGADQEALARRDRVPAYVAAAQAIIDEAGARVDWIYVNYADPCQDPLRSYGAENVRKIRDAAAKYDPGAVFQTRCPGGWKISRVAE